MTNPIPPSPPAPRRPVGWAKREACPSGIRDNHTDENYINSGDTTSPRRGRVLQRQMGTALPLPILQIHEASTAWDSCNAKGSHGKPHATPTVRTTTTRSNHYVYMFTMHPRCGIHGSPKVPMANPIPPSPPAQRRPVGWAKREACPSGRRENHTNENYINSGDAKSPRRDQLHPRPMGTALPLPILQVHAASTVLGLVCNGACQLRTSILPVTAEEMRAVRRSCISAITHSDF